MLVNKKHGEKKGGKLTYFRFRWHCRQSADHPNSQSVLWSEVKCRKDRRQNENKKAREIMCERENEERIELGDRAGIGNV